MARGGDVAWGLGGGWAWRAAGGRQGLGTARRGDRGWGHCSRPPDGHCPQLRAVWPRPALPSAPPASLRAAPFPGPALALGSRTSCGEPGGEPGGRGGGRPLAIGRSGMSLAGREARQVAHSLCPRSPASAWSPSFPNALYRGSSRPLSPHRMADGGSPFLGRRDFVYPSSTRGKDQILLFFSPGRLCPVPPGVWQEDPRAAAAAAAGAWVGRGITPSQPPPPPPPHMAFPS